MSQEASPQRVAYYVDGFNLYHGCFANLSSRESWRKFRWLDLNTMCSRIYPNGTTVGIRYFTATVDKNAEDPQSFIRQQTYLRALRTTKTVTIHLGRFSTYAKLRMVAESENRPVIAATPEQYALVIESREKGSDVNLASHLLLDGFEDTYDLAVVITNDSDLATPIRMIRENLGKRVAIVNPRKRTAIDLKGIANSYKVIRRSWLENAQFPMTLTDENGDFTKPAHWQ
ncbi:MAG: NYN domain-containing protein [Thermomicrobiales bacterium]|nr:NYN domain-containing protein [Thermomicrobiales bacterium]